MRTLLGTVDGLAEAMSFHRERHAVLSGNIANIDTPGYQPVDLERPGTLPTNGAGVELARTEPGHQAAGEDGWTLRAFADPLAAGQGGDGNSVSLEREMAKLSANRTRYLTAAELVSRRLALLRYAASGGSGG